MRTQAYFSPFRYSVNTDKWGSSSISTCFSVNPNLFFVFTPPPKAQAVPAGSAFCFMCPCGSTYVRCVSAHRCLRGCVGALACVQIYVSWVVLYMYFSLSFPDSQHICLSNKLSVWVCVRACVRACYLFHGPPHPYDNMSRMPRLDAFFCNLFCLI